MRSSKSSVKTFEPEGIEVYPISAVSGKGVERTVIMHVKALLAECPQDTIVVYEQEFFPELLSGRRMNHTRSARARRRMKSMS